MAQLYNVNIHHLSERFKSKNELYKFLIQDCQAYLPSVDSTNIYFFKDIVRGAKDVSFTYRYIITTEVC
jgi:hypothetical protein